MPGARLVELLDVALADQIARDANETIRGEIEREVPHAFFEGSPDDIDHRGGVTTYGVFDMKDVADSRLEQVVMRGNSANVVKHLGFLADRDPRSGGDLEVAIDAGLGVEEGASAVAFAVGDRPFRNEF